MIEVWIGRAGKRSGPYPVDKVLAAHRQGKLHESDLLWWQGQAQWEPAATALGKLQSPGDVPGVAPAPAAGAPASGELQLEPIPAEPTTAAPASVAASAAARSVDAGRKADPLSARGRQQEQVHAAATEDDALADAPYAGFWRRFAAVVIDSIVVGIAQAILAAVLVRPTVGVIDTNVLAVQLIALLVAWGYTAGFESSRWRATPGKRLLGMRVVRAGSYERISLARATGRFFARFLSWFILFIGYFMQPFTEQRQTLHDKLTDVVVVKV